jgi:hypothetical protein
VRGANRATRKEEEVRHGARVAPSLGACEGSGACGETEGAATTHTRLGCSHTVHYALGGLGPDASRERGSVTHHPPSQHTHITHWRGMGRTPLFLPPLPPHHFPTPTRTPQPPCPTCRAGSVALWVVQPGGTPKAPRGTGSCSAVDAIEPAVAWGGAVSSELRRAQGVYTKGCGCRGTAALEAEQGGGAAGVLGRGYGPCLAEVPAHACACAGREQASERESTRGEGLGTTWGPTSVSPCSPRPTRRPKQKAGPQAAPTQPHSPLPRDHHPSTRTTHTLIQQGSR